MQAKKIKEQTIQYPPVIEEQPEFVLPQPSLLDLSQDKITLDAGEIEPEDEDLSTSVKERRRSFRDLNSFTKPNLKHPELTPYKDSNAKPSKTSTEGPELFMGLNIDELKSLNSSSLDLLAELLSKGDALLVSQDKLSSGKVSIVLSSKPRLCTWSQLFKFRINCPCTPILKLFKVKILPILTP